MGGGKGILVVDTTAAGAPAVPTVASIPGGESVLLAARRSRVVVEEGRGAGRGEASSGVAGDRVDSWRSVQALGLRGVVAASGPGGPGPGPTA